MRYLKIGEDLQSKNPKLASEWHPTKNGELKPSNVAKASNKKVWWMCEKGHEWQASIFNRYCYDSKCPYCSGLYVIQGFNDLQTCNPEIASEWHPSKNGRLKPSDVTKGSQKKYGGYVKMDMSGKLVFIIKPKVNIVHYVLEEKEQF